MKLCGACILTNNVPQLVDFYQVVLLESPEGDSTHSAFPKAQLAIWNPGNVSVSRDKNVTIMYFVDDADGVYSRLQKSGLGIEFVSVPTVKPWGVKSFGIMDPDGNELSFLEQI